MSLHRSTPWPGSDTFLCPAAFAQPSYCSIMNTEYMQHVVQIAHRAGAAIMGVYRSGEAGQTSKADDSPLTLADLAAHRVIAEGLGRFAPEIPRSVRRSCRYFLCRAQPMGPFLAGRSAGRDQGVSEAQRRIHGEHCTGRTRHTGIGCRVCAGAGCLLLRRTRHGRLRTAWRRRCASHPRRGACGWFRHQGGCQPFAQRCSHGGVAAKTGQTRMYQHGQLAQALPDCRGGGPFLSASGSRPWNGTPRQPMPW